MKLCQVLNEKICHDFAGTVSVIENSVQLINSPVYQEKATNLIESSAKRLISYLQFYRYLYSASFDGNKITISEISKSVTNFLKFKNHNIKLEFNKFVNIAVDDNVAKVIMCLIVAASNNYFKDGAINTDLKIEDNKLTNIKVIVTSSSLKITQDKIDILLGKKMLDYVNLEDVHEYYSYYLMTECSYNLCVIASTNSVEYNAIMKNS